MTADNHSQNRELQRDARAWKAFTGTPFTAAVRQLDDPLTQGLLGPRITARHMIAVLSDHELLRPSDGEQILSDNGYESNTPWQFNGKTDFLELVLIAEALQMFTPVPDAAASGVNSYSLKHTIERFLGAHLKQFSYVTNGRLIWAAAAAGLAIAAPDDSGPNLMIGIAEREHDYVRRMVTSGLNAPKGHHFRPAGFEHLQTVLTQAAAGEPLATGWVRPTPVIEPAPFHDWLLSQIGRDDSVGALAIDYASGIHGSYHGIARNIGDLLGIIQEAGSSVPVIQAAFQAVEEWMSANPPEEPFRTQLISEDRSGHAGWGAGTGTVERYVYLCPCGSGEIIEEHDNIPGFRDHDVRISCDECRTRWTFASGKGVRDWGLVSLAASTPA